MEILSFTVYPTPVSKILNPSKQTTKSFPDGLVVSDGGSNSVLPSLGGAGVGVLVLSGNFAYTNNNDVVKTYLRTIVNNTVFDTTQSNELQFTYQNDGTNPLTNIRIDQASFTKWY